jgi:FkbH-like protein
MTIAITTRLLEQTKLVIWDLDDTFWDGTLLEGTMRYVPAHHDLVVALSKRGIINSICSHNDREQALDVLCRHGIADYFVFPEISYDSKGAAVARIIEAAQLRAANIVFLDDSERMRGEVAAINPNVLAIPRERFTSENHTARAETDPHLHRLADYRLLETKHCARAASTLCSDDFLRSCDIRIREHPALEHRDRVLELIHRANQLNFTKRRITEAELAALAESPEHHLTAYEVDDRFGNYGIAGFSCLDTRSHRMDHFVFSCRVLGMGIEQFLYARFDRPALEIAGEVASHLDVPTPDWIRLDARVREGTRFTSQRATSIFIKGGCDLIVTAEILATVGDVQVTTELHRLSADGIRMIWPEHTDVLLLALELRRGRALPPELAGLPWFDAEVWSTRFPSQEHEVQVLSLLQDYGCGTYCLRRDASVIVPAEYFGLELCRPDERLFTVGVERAASFGMTPDFLAWFRTHFEPCGPITPLRLRSNIEALLAELPPTGRLILINGAEVEIDQPYPFDHRQLSRHVELNSMIDKLVASDSRVGLVDVRPLVRSPADLTDKLFHYQRAVHARIARAIIDQL